MVLVPFADIAELVTDEADDYFQVSELARCLIDCGLVPADALYEILIVGDEGVNECLQPIGRCNRARWHWLHFFSHDISPTAKLRYENNTPDLDGGQEPTVENDALQITPGRDCQPLPCLDQGGTASVRDPLSLGPESPRAFPSSKANSGGSWREDCGEIERS